MNHKKGTNWYQLQFMRSLDEMVAENSVARQVDSFCREYRRLVLRQGDG